MGNQKQYASYLSNNPNSLWKRLLYVQAPFRWNIRQLRLGFTLDIGCGVGRNLAHLQGQGIGIDINPYCVQISRERGYKTYLPEEFNNTEYNQPARFDSILVSHVLEHMTLSEAIDLLATRIKLLRSGGMLVALTPQEAGFRADPTHIEFMDYTKLQFIYHQIGLEVERQYSFPLPRFWGRVFRYNEFVVVSRMTA